MNPESLFIVVVIHAVDAEDEDACTCRQRSSVREEIPADGPGNGGKLRFRYCYLTRVLAGTKHARPFPSEGSKSSFVRCWH